MIYKIDVADLESINHLIFDANAQFEDLQGLSIEKPIAIEIERRCFERVKRKKFLFWTSTSFGGKTSVIRLSGVSKIELEGIDERFRDNHFINEITYDPSDNILALNTAFGLSIKFTVSEDFRGELVDLKDSSFGAGTLFGSKGFTEEEWEAFRKN
ncbi:hypothetical protein [Pontibacter chinhatensis]|uniref:Uncharacterized protein n=1 Tax=Pontibacter chinhatensis TaxID=1436961 RepID=A0A1I2PDT9_9BACT|nr:hypothetical protein [Pontibacter chinhatensis]SFG13653.1 hypothetical protein SAMN05421739_1011000 [Pontibacter chinhatensis]